MGLLVRIFQKLYRFGSLVIQHSLIEDPYHEYPLVVWLANILIIILLVGGFSLALYLFVWAISLEIFLDALLIAYLLAWSWEQLCKEFTSFAQEMYLMVSTVGYTVFLGTVIQLQRMPWAYGRELLVYWAFLLILGLSIWRVTVFHVGKAAVKPILAIKKIEYKKHFRLTKIPKEISTENQAQAYLKKMK